MFKKQLKISYSVIIAIIISLGLSIAIQSLLAWTAPTAVPPGNNIATPINTSSTGQSKDGGLILNHLDAATNGLIVENGNVGIGTTSPKSRLYVNGNFPLAMPINWSTVKHSLSNNNEFPLTIENNDAYIRLIGEKQSSGQSGIIFIEVENGDYNDFWAIDRHATGLDGSAGNLYINYSASTTDPSIWWGDFRFTKFTFTPNGEFGINTNKVGAGSDNEGNLLTMVGINQDVRHYSNSDTLGHKSDYDFMRSKGTYDVPTVIDSGMDMGTIRFNGYDGAVYRAGAQIKGSTDGIPAMGDMPGQLHFRTFTSGGTGLTTKMTIRSSGDIHILNPGAKITMKSPDGLTCSECGIDNVGAWGCSVVVCP